MKTLRIGPEERILVDAEQGQKWREDFGLDKFDREDGEATIKIDTTAVLPEFIRALISDSVRYLGFADFTKKYHFDAAPSVRENILENARVEDRGRGTARG